MLPLCLDNLKNGVTLENYDVQQKLDLILLAILTYILSSFALLASYPLWYT